MISFPSDADLEISLSEEDMSSSIRYCAISRLSDGAILAAFTHKGADPECSQTVARVLGSGNVRAESQLTVTVNDRVGTLHLSASSWTVLAVVTAADYPRRSAFKLLAELREHVKGVTDNATVMELHPGGLKDQCGNAIKEVCVKYSELHVDKVAAVATQVDEVKAVMEGNINKVLQNTESLNVVQDKTEVLRSEAEQFQRSGTRLKRQMWLRTYKVKIIIVILALVILAYVLIPVLVRLT